MFQTTFDSISYMKTEVNTSYTDEVLNTWEHPVFKLFDELAPVPVKIQKKKGPRLLVVDYVRV